MFSSGNTLALGREFGVSVAQRAKKHDQVGSFVESGGLDIPKPYASPAISVDPLEGETATV